MKTIAASELKKGDVIIESSKKHFDVLDIVTVSDKQIFLKIKRVVSQGLFCETNYKYSLNTKVNIRG